MACGRVHDSLSLSLALSLSAPSLHPPIAATQVPASRRKGEEGVMSAAPPAPRRGSRHSAPAAWRPESPCHACRHYQALAESGVSEGGGEGGGTGEEGYWGRGEEAGRASTRASQRVGEEGWEGKGEEGRGKTWREGLREGGREGGKEGAGEEGRNGARQGG